MNWFRISLAMTGKMCISGAFSIIYVFSAEIFPTCVRTIGIGAGSVCARVGGLVAPFIADLVGPCRLYVKMYDVSCNCTLLCYCTVTLLY